MSRFLFNYQFSDFWKKIIKFINNHYWRYRIKLNQMKIKKMQKSLHFIREWNAHSIFFPFSIIFFHNFPHLLQAIQSLSLVFHICGSQYDWCSSHRPGTYRDGGRVSWQLLCAWLCKLRKPCTLVASWMHLFSICKYSDRKFNQLMSYLSCLCSHLCFNYIIAKLKCLFHSNKRKIIMWNA
jgi:hypothetical protein